MFDQYLITGATGFLGRAVAEELVRRRAQVHALVLHNDPYIHLLPKEVHTVVGDVCTKNSLTDFFADAGSRTCVIHCAGVVSVASRPGSKLYQVNVGGTWRVLRQCMKRNVGRLIHVSSVHAIPEKPKGCIITEDFVRPLCHHSQDASARGKGCKAELSPHLPAAGACKAGGSILRTPKPEGAKAAVLHPLFRCRPCLKRLLQPCRSIGMLCVSAAPRGGDLAGHDSLASESKGNVILYQPKAPRADYALWICSAISVAISTHSMI